MLKQFKKFVENKIQNLVYKEANLIIKDKSYKVADYSNLQGQKDALLDVLYYIMKKEKEEC